MTTAGRDGITGVLAAVVLLAATAFAQPAAGAQAPAPAEVRYADDDKSLRAQADQYVKAFAAGDAAAIAGMWTADGTYIGEDGVAVRGRGAIQKFFTDFFAVNGGQPLQVTIESIRFPAPNVAIEEGVGRLLRAPSPSVASRYTVVHLKDRGQWRMDSVTETAYTPSSTSEYLKDLAWLVGNWTATRGADKVHLSARWVAGGHFLFCAYHPEGTPEGKMSDAQIIGWDPENKQIFSSSYGAGGGFGHATWSRNGQTWMLRAWDVQPDGSRATADYLLRPIDKNTFAWQSVNRTLDGTPLPDSSEITIVRDTSDK